LPRGYRVARGSGEANRDGEVSVRSLPDASHLASLIPADPLPRFLASRQIPCVSNENIRERDPVDLRRCSP
jgi:hypothetical protein